MAKILAGDAKVIGNLVDKSVYAPVVGSNIVGILGVFEDGEIEKANYISSRDEMRQLLGAPVLTYNSGTKNNYSYDALNSVLSQHNQVWVFRVTDGSEKRAEYKPSGSVIKVLSKNKTARWNGVVVSLKALDAVYQGDSPFKAYEISFFSKDEMNLIESYQGNMMPTSDDYLLDVVNLNSRRFRLETQEAIETDKEVAEGKLGLEKFKPTVTPISFKLYKSGVDSKLSMELSIRESSSKRELEFKSIHLKDSSGVNSWRIDQDHKGVTLNINNSATVGLDTFYAMINSFAAYELKFKNESSEYINLNKAQIKELSLDLSKIEESYESSEKTEVTKSVGVTETTYLKKLKSEIEHLLAGGKSGLDDIGVDDYIRVAQLLEVRSDYPVNLIAAPGVVDSGVHKFIDTIIEKRGGDALQIVDIKDYSDTTQMLEDLKVYSSNKMAIYHPWIEITDFRGAKKLVPPSGEVLAMYGFNDANGEPWFAPAGAKRGLLKGATGVSRNLTQGDRDRMQSYPNIVNPIIIDSGGVLAWGNLTASRVSSKLREISVMRLNIYLFRVIEALSKQYLFEPNISLNHEQWKLEVSNELDQVLSRNGIYDYEVKLGEKDGTMTAYHFDRNIAKAVVKYRPVGYIHFLVFDMEVHSYGSKYTVSEE